MPLKSWSSKKTIAKNISKLVTEKPWTARTKAIKTIAKKQWITQKQAKVKQAVAIAYSKAGKYKSKK